MGGEEEGEEEPEADLLQLQEEAVPVPVSPTSSVEPEVGEDEGAPYTPEYTPEPRPKHLQHQLDTCSVSSSASGSTHVEQEKPAGQLHRGETDSATFSAPPEEEELEKFSSFLEDEDDEIRV